MKYVDRMIGGDDALNAFERAGEQISHMEPTYRMNVGDDEICMDEDDGEQLDEQAIKRFGAFTVHCARWSGGYIGMHMHERRGEQIRQTKYVARMHDNEMSERDGEQFIHTKYVHLNAEWISDKVYLDCLNDGANEMDEECRDV